MCKLCKFSDSVFGREKDLGIRSIFKCLVPCKAIRILESGKSLLVKLGIVGFRFRKPAQGLESKI